MTGRALIGLTPIESNHYSCRDKFLGGYQVSLLCRGSPGEGAGKKGEKEGVPLPNLRAINPMERSLCGGESYQVTTVSKW